MKLFDSLKFVKNGYARTDLIPELTHYTIKNKRVTAFNGMIAFSSPINLDLDLAPAAIHFHKCIEACKDVISITVVKDKIKIKSGSFTSTVKCIPTDKIPTIIPRGVRYELPRGFVESIEKLLPIIETTNDRVYATGLTFRDQSAIVTNNVIFIEKWIGIDLPAITIPRRAIQEICRYGKEIQYILVSEDMIFFFYEDERWIASKLLVVELPNFSAVLDQTSNPKPFPDGFWPALDLLEKFADEIGKVTIKTGEIITGDESTNNDEASVSIPDLVMEDNCLFNVRQLLKLKGLVDTIDLQYGRACLFYGEKLRGAIVGYRK